MANFAGVMRGKYCQRTPLREAMMINYIVMFTACLWAPVSSLVQRLRMKIRIEPHSIFGQPENSNQQENFSHFFKVIAQVALIILAIK